MFNQTNNIRAGIELTADEHALLMLACEVIESQFTHAWSRSSANVIKNVGTLKRSLHLTSSLWLRYQAGQSIQWMISDRAAMLLKQTIMKGTRWRALDALAMKKGQLDGEVDHDYAEMDNKHQVRHASRYVYIREYSQHYRQLIGYKSALLKKIQQRLLMSIH